MAPRLGYINTVHVGKFRRANRLPIKRANCGVKWSQPRLLQVFAGTPALRSEPRTETVLSAYDLRVGFANHYPLRANVNALSAKTYVRQEKLSRSGKLL